MVYGILITSKTSSKAQRFLRALHRSGIKAGIDCKLMTKYQPCDTLILYGLGGDDRLPVANRHRATGGNYIAWDLPYWDRNGRKFRLSLNANHPSEVMDGPAPSPTRYESANLPHGSVADPSGPIMLIGNAPKSIRIGAEGWSKSKSIEISKLFPDKQVIYRPKPKRPIEPGVVYHHLSHGPIDDALRGCSLVVCLHSNVAVDACRMGVPVACDAGAASLIYPTLENYQQQPSEELRREFLERLAYWQWADTETGKAWAFIQEKLCV